MIDPRYVAFYVPAGLKKFKQVLFDRIADHIQKQGGMVVRHRPELLRDVPDEIIPITGSGTELRPIMLDWKARKRRFVHWDRGYL